MNFCHWWSESSCSFPGHESCSWFVAKFMITYNSIKFIVPLFNYYCIVSISSSGNVNLIKYSLRLYQFFVTDVSYFSTNTQTLNFLLFLLIIITFGASLGNVMLPYIWAGHKFGTWISDFWPPYLLSHDRNMISFYVW